MKKLFLSSVALCAMVSMASAADLAARPYTKAPVVAPIYNWSGFYVGANGGYGSSHSCWDYQGDPGGCHNATGGTVGGQLGYRWQYSNWVFGLEAQGNWANFKGSSIDLTYSDYNDKTHIDSFGLFTGQVGYAWDNVLLYAKGGAAVVGLKYSNPQISPPRDYNGSVTRWGGVVGVGLEYGFARNWSVGVEWNHIFLGKKNVTVVNPADATDNFVEHIGENIDMGLVRVNYRF
ncbi:MAG: porin family protein [Afipia felis]|nr:porin family protein [Afipia felis]